MDLWSASSSRQTVASEIRAWNTENVAILKVQHPNRRNNELGLITRWVVSLRNLTNSRNCLHLSQYWDRPSFGAIWQVWIRMLPFCWFFSPKKCYSLFHKNNVIFGQYHRLREIDRNSLLLHLHKISRTCVIVKLVKLVKNAKNCEQFSTGCIKWVVTWKIDISQLLGTQIKFWKKIYEDLGLQHAKFHDNGTTHLDATNLWRT